MSCFRLSKGVSHSTGLKLIFLLMAVLLALSTALIAVVSVSADIQPPGANNNALHLDIGRPAMTYYDGDTIHYSVTISVPSANATENYYPCLQTSITSNFTRPDGLTVDLPAIAELWPGQSVTYNATDNSALDYVIRHIDEDASHAVIAYAQSDGIAHDYQFGNDTNHQATNISTRVDHISIPDTTVTITASALQVISGGSMTLTVTEDNTGDVPLTNVSVVLTGGPGMPLTLTNATALYFVAGSDINGDGILDTNETWQWTGIPSGALSAPTTFIAQGYGTDPAGIVITYPTHPDEQDEVTVVLEARPPTVPTIGQWGMISMAIVFAGLMVWAVQRRVKVA